eukprot:4441905-Amphidinium_carterae.1
MELLWLDPADSLTDALDKLKYTPEHLGLAATVHSRKRRYAIRYKDEAALKLGAAAIGYAEPANTGRFKAFGVQAHMGAAGLMATLAQAHWVVAEVLYFGEDSAVFEATKASTKTKL